MDDHRGKHMSYNMVKKITSSATADLNTLRFFPLYLNTPPCMEDSCISCRSLQLISSFRPSKPLGQGRPAPTSLP